MRKAITISVLFHVALLTWALGYFATGDSPKPIKKTTIPVDIMTPSQFTKIKQGKKTAPKKKAVVPVVKKIKKKVAKKKPVVKKPKRIVKAKPKPKPKKKVVKAKPKPKPVKKAKAKIKPKKVKRKVVKRKIAKAKAKPRRKPIKKTVSRPRSEFDPENIAALLNKLPDKRVTPRTRPLAPAPKRQARPQRPVYGRSYGNDTTMSANEIDAFKAQISQCWNPPTGGLGSRDLNVKLRIRFKQDGTLEKPPELANYSGSPFFRPAAEAAKRAVWQCQPYRMPRDKFATWQDMILNFDPREMLGG